MDHNSRRPGGPRTLGSSAQAQDEIVSYLKVYTGEAGEEVLFLKGGDRKRSRGLPGVRAGLGRRDREDCFSLRHGKFPYCFVHDRQTNLLIIRTENVNTGDRLNAAALEKYKMPAEVISAMVETTR